MFSVTGLSDRWTWDRWQVGWGRSRIESCAECSLAYERAWRRGWEEEGRGLAGWDEPRPCVSPDWAVGHRLAPQCLIPLRNADVSGPAVSA